MAASFEESVLGQVLVGKYRLQQVRLRGIYGVVFQAEQFFCRTFVRPVLVKVSYFPNWKVSGATGPWRAAPNLMVVVPTSHQVVLSYGATNADRAGQVVTAVAVAVAVGLAALAWRTKRRARARLGPSGSPTRPG